MHLLPLQFRQRGLSLIELMVAILLSSLLLLGVLELYSNTSRADRSGSALADLQDDARVAMEFIKRDIRRAGYLGCADPQAGFSGMDFDYPEDAFREMTLTSLTLSYASPDALNGATGSPATLVLSNTASGIDKWHLITDCQTAVPFKGNYVSASRTVSSATPADIRDFPSSTSYLHEFREVRYSLANGNLTRRTQDSGDRDFPPAPEAIISGVTALSFAYGLATSAGTITWFDATNPPPAIPSVAQFVDLSQIKITLTLQSATDAAISKSFTSVVQLRNRL